MGAEEDRWPPNRLPRPNRLWLFPFGTCGPAAARSVPNGVDLVFLSACFSRLSTLSLNFLASFSSTNDRPARHSSSSKEWKNVRS
jgi:hypothetical protein